MEREIERVGVCWLGWRRAAFFQIRRRLGSTMQHGEQVRAKREEQRRSGKHHETETIQMSVTCLTASLWTGAKITPSVGF